MTLHLDTAITAGQAVTVSYSKPTSASNQLMDSDGLAVESFSSVSVSNIVPTVFSSATTSADGASVFIEFTDSLSLLGPVHRNGLTVTVDGTGQTPGAIVRVSGNHKRAQISVSPDITPGQTVTVSYSKPANAGHRLTDRRGGEVDAFTNQPVNNAVPATVSSIVIISDPGPDQTYQGGDTIRAAVRFNADVTVTTVARP